jgi:hypothetical protein
VAIDLGDVYRCSFDNYSPDGALVNADTMTLTITQPDDTLVTRTIEPASTGRYLFDFTTAIAGRHRVNWLGTGTNPGADADVFDVLPGNPGYIISLADAKKQLNSKTEVNDDELRDFIAATTAIIEEIRGEAVARRTFTDEREICTGRFPLTHTPVVSLTSVATVDGFITWDVSRLHVSPAGVVAPNPYVNTGLLELKGWIRVVYTAGYQIIPPNIGMAARVILQHLWKTQRPGMGAPSRSALDDAVVTGSGYAIPYSARDLLGAGMPGFA